MLLTEEEQKETLNKRGAKGCVNMDCYTNTNNEEKEEENCFGVRFFLDSSYSEMRETLTSKRAKTGDEEKVN